MLLLQMTKHDLRENQEKVTGMLGVKERTPSRQASIEHFFRTGELKSSMNFPPKVILCSIKKRGISRVQSSDPVAEIHPEKMFRVDDGVQSECCRLRVVAQGFVCRDDSWGPRQ